MLFKEKSWLADSRYWTRIREYGRLIAVGTHFTVRLKPPSDNTNPVAHFLANMNDLIEYALRDVDDSDMVDDFSTSCEPE